MFLRNVITEAEKICSETAFPNNQFDRKNIDVNKFSYTVKNGLFDLQAGEITILS